ncbi:MAG: DUF1345 domain-containing protein [Proteobacteria bacterium]|nr:DUF1345 domain-containing protein [Pseudomonadota bacterium]
MTLHRFYHPFLARPSLITGLIVMILGYFVTPFDWRWTTKGVIAWDLGVFVTLVMLVRLMSKKIAADEMAKRSKRLDEGRGAVLLIGVLGATAAIAAVIVEMTLNKGDKGVHQIDRLGLIITTVALSWAFVQMIFAVHYAHDYYLPLPDPDIDLVTDEIVESPRRVNRTRYRCGLDFPGNDETPDYWDFVHFSVVIGVACATADVNIESKAIRRLVTAHCALAFVFNAVILALTINLSASAFS